MSNSEQFQALVKELKNNYKTGEYIKICTLTVDGKIKQKFFNVNPYIDHIQESINNTIEELSDDRLKQFEKYESFFMVKVFNKTDITMVALGITEYKRDDLILFEGALK